jgi:aspartyl-tRNA(Asn)/glutamyl-tRNA(Gln) amidotransferase subunit A
MATSDDLAFAPAHGLRDLIGRKQLSPVELTELTLRRIEALNPKLNAFITVTADLARESARNAEAQRMRGEPLGPLHGIPVSIKDLEGIAGVRFTRGSLLHRDDVCDRDALCVERLRRAGAIIVGTTNTPEFGAAGTTENRIGPPCRNPWNPERTSGGSSGGAAASVAAGITAVAQGSDGGGSIRIPASFCGIYGIKATQGRVPRRHSGLHSWHPMNNSSAGPMTRDVRDAAVLLNVLAGPGPDTEYGTIQASPPDFTSAIGRGVRGLTMAWSPDFGGVPVDPEVVEICASAARVFERLGARVEETAFRPDDPMAVLDAFGTFSAAKTYTTHADAAERPDLLTDYFLDTLERGRSLSAERLFTALSRITAYRAYTREFFTRFDLLLSPTLAVAAFPIGQLPETIGGRTVAVRRLGYFPFTYPFNVLGNPAATVPCGFTRDEMPVGLQIVGRLEDELAVLAASAAFEGAQPWSGRRPPVSAVGV